MQTQVTPQKRGLEGIEERHSRSCPTHTPGGQCCAKSYRAHVYDKRAPVIKDGVHVRDEKGRLRYGVKRKKTFAGKGAKSAAKQWRAHMVSDIRRGKVSAPTARTLREAAEEWIALAEAGKTRRKLKPKVVRSYRADLERHVLPALGALRLSEVRRTDVQNLADRLEQGGGVEGRPLSPSRVRNVLMPLRAIYRYELRRDDGLTVNPTQGLELSPDEGQRDRVASPEEAERLFAVLPDDARAVYGTAFYGGLRCGELLALRWSDVDLAKGVLRVERSWDDKVGEVAPKSRKGTRGVPINGTLRDYLDAQKARTGRGGEDFVFGSSATHVFTPTNIRRKARAAWEEANRERAQQHIDPLKPIGLHECRHSYVSWMHEAGHTLEEIGDYVGHASTYMVDRYRHLLEGHERRSVARQDEYLGNGSLDAGGLVRTLRDLLEGAKPAELARHAAEIRALIEGHLAQAESDEEPHAGAEDKR